LVRGFQKLDVLSGTGLFATPLPIEVWLVPDLVGVDAALVPSGQCPQIVGPVTQPVGWSIVRIDRHCASPGRVTVHPSDYLQPRIVDCLHDAIRLVPLELTL